MNLRPSGYEPKTELSTTYNHVIGLCFFCTVYLRFGTPDVFPDYSGYAASASPSRACRIVFHPSAFLSFPLRYHSM